MRLRRLLRIAAVLSLPLFLSGCAGPIVARLTLGDISTIASVVSTVVTGKDWTDHALDAITGKDCNVTEGILRKARKICEERGSEQARLDFKGVFVYFGGEDADPLGRFASARQHEIAEERYAATPVVVSDAMVSDRLPESGGSPRLVFVGGRIVYAMGTIDTPAHAAPHRHPRAHAKPADPVAVSAIADHAILP